MSIDTGLSPTEALVAFASSAKPPKPQIEAARAALYDTVQRAFDGAHDREMTLAFETVAVWLTPPLATVLGRRDRCGPQWAAFVNGIAARATIVPAALATAEYGKAGGEVLLEAIAIGYEVEARLLRAAGGAHEERGWDVRGTLGHVAAALAAGRVLGAHRDALRNALGIAGTQAAGLRAAGGTMTEAYICGKAAADAVESVLLAQRGFTGPARPLEGRRGLAALMASGLDFAIVSEGLADVWIAQGPAHTAPSAKGGEAAGFVAAVLAT